MARDAKSRLRWHLKAEQAFGLRSVAVGRRIADTQADDGRENVAPAVPPVVTRSAGNVVKNERDQSAPPTSAARVVKPTQAHAPEPGTRLAPDADAPPFAAQPHNSGDKRSLLAALDASEVRGCVKCRLCETRTNTVFGEGDADARIFVIGEGPGENEDRQGRPFVGRAGELLNKWIAAMGLLREQVFIANIVKCRPPGNREPAPDEVATCTPYLQRQLEIVRPRVIITLGKPSAQYMLQSKLAMGKLRGHWHDWRGIKLMPTYHPAYVLRQYTYETRSAVWSDLQMVMAELNLPMPKGKPG